MHKRNNKITKYKKYKAQSIQVHILPKHPHNCQNNNTYKTHTYTHPHITKEVKITTVQDTSNEIVTVYSSTLSKRSHYCTLYFCPQELHLALKYRYPKN